MEWPPYSPDLSPIEHLWDQLKTAIAERQPPVRNRRELVQAVHEEWNRIPQFRIIRLVSSMRRRCTACCDARGGHHSLLNNGVSYILVLSLVVYSLALYEISCCKYRSPSNTYVVNKITYVYWLVEIKLTYNFQCVLQFLARAFLMVLSILKAVIKGSYNVDWPIAECRSWYRILFFFCV